MRSRKEISKGNILPKRLRVKDAWCTNCGYEGPSDTFYSLSGKRNFCKAECSRDFWESDRKAQLRTDAYRIWKKRHNVPSSAWCPVFSNAVAKCPCPLCQWYNGKEWESLEYWQLEESAPPGPTCEKLFAKLYACDCSYCEHNKETWLEGVNPPARP